VNAFSLYIQKQRNMALLMMMFMAGTGDRRLIKNLFLTGEDGIMYKIYFRNAKGNAFCEVMAEDSFNAESAFAGLCKAFLTVILYRGDKIVKQYNNDF
jgi:hypothetical protein